LKKIELLAPAQNLEWGKAALLSGADAVYIGGPSFGARKKASNSLKDIESLVKFATPYQAKVYVALNTLILEQELPAVQKLLWQLYQTGIDALIIQDMGILEMDLPPLGLFASTQTHNNSLNQVLFLEKTGFKRVILARELSLKEIAFIKSKTSVQLEAFVHGALCVSYSGQCYLSYALGGRSGNRGECAQPCREPYILQDYQGKVLKKQSHVLSLKDLNRINDLELLINAGITSFKIEGRLKDKTYLINVCAAYRQALDNLLEKKGLQKSSLGKSDYAFIPNLDKTFNRGYIRYFLEKREKPMAHFKTPKWQGQLLGKVLKVEEKSFVLEKLPLDGSGLNSFQDVKAGDGISFFDSFGVLQGSFVHKVVENTIFLQNLKGIQKNTLIYKNHDAQFEKKLLNPLPTKKIGVCLKFFETPTGFGLTATEEGGLSYSQIGVIKKVKATNPLKAQEIITKQLSKMGGTSFYLSSLTFDVSQDYFFPIAFLNQLRREVLENLWLLKQNKVLKTEKPIINQEPYFKDCLELEGNVTNSLAHQFYTKRGVKKIEKGAEAGGNLKNKALMTLKYCLSYELGNCLKNAPQTQKKFFLKNAKGTVLELKLDCENCQNHIYFKKLSK